MKTTLSALLLAGLAAVVPCLMTQAQGTGSDLKAKIPELRAQAKELFGPIPDKMPGSENDTPALVRLGKKLYFDKRLSANNTQSCNDCHLVDQKRAGVDNEPTSKGAFGKRGDRNSPTTLNAGFHFAQFWDGRAPTLQEQAKGPILNPVEMAMPSEAAVLECLSADKKYRAMFDAAFPAATPALTYDHLAQAIAAFERTLITRDRFDDFQKGNDRALKPVELKGLDLFLTYGCTTCHVGPVLGATLYQKVGLVHSYETPDKGRFTVTKDEDDLHKFKVPSLRNVALTAPYFHDGTQGTLKETVRKMAYLQLDKQLTNEEAEALVAFLNTLSDKSRARRR